MNRKSLPLVLAAGLAGITATGALADERPDADASANGAPPAAPRPATCPAPGTGLPGALNMAAAGDGMVRAMTVDAPQDNVGMFKVVANSAC